MQTNHTPFTDICTLIAQEKRKGEDGYDDSVMETAREVFCSVCDGVTRSEFYEAYKAGVKLTLTVEINDGDYNAERLLEHDGKRYQIIRTYPSGYGTLECTCAEVVR